MGGWQLGNAPADFPLTYPGAAPPGDALLYGATLRPLVRVAPESAQAVGNWAVRYGSKLAPLDGVLADAGAAPLADRRAVLAVGSNANAAQMAKKLAGGHPRRGILPMIQVRANGVATGHSAHVGRWGYVPRTPVAKPGWHAQWVIWVDEDQAAIVDATEVNYDVVKGTKPLVLTADFAVTVRDWVMYRSKWGALSGSPAAMPMPAMAQEDMFAILLRQPWFAAIMPAGADSPARAATLLARYEPLRDEARDAMAANGWAVNDGLQDAVPA